MGREPQDFVVNLASAPEYTVGGHSKLVEVGIQKRGSCTCRCWCTWEAGWDGAGCGSVWHGREEGDAGLIPTFLRLPFTHLLIY